MAIAPSSFPSGWHPVQQSQLRRNYFINIGLKLFGKVLRIAAIVDLKTRKHARDGLRRTHLVADEAADLSCSTVPVGPRNLSSHPR